MISHIRKSFLNLGVAMFALFLLVEFYLKSTTSYSFQLPSSARVAHRARNHSSSFNAEVPILLSNSASNYGYWMSAANESGKEMNRLLSDDESGGVDDESKNNLQKEEEDNEEDVEEEKRLRNSPYIYSKVSEKTRFTSCHYNNCRFVTNMSQADAVMFQAAHIRDHVIPHFHRPEGQRWIFFTSDPAIKNYDLARKDVGSQFNWTMTYQLDSDVPTVFGFLRRRLAPKRDYDASFERKDRLAAWFVSHCPTWGRRDEYVARMRRILPVDIFGKCGNMTCGPIHYRRRDSIICLPMLSRHYKFYLAFENSFCKDYISEKFFKLFKDVDIIPVVRGGFQYKKYLPSGIFVDAADFKNPEDLSQYLLQLGQDKERYTAMLRRKSKWIEAPPEPFHCIVCRALHTADPGPHYHQNLRDKFNGNPSHCWQPTDLA